MQKMKFVRPHSISDALQILEGNTGETRILSGGTDLIVALREGIISCRTILDIKAIPGLNKITYSPSDGLSVGAAVNLNEIANSQVIKQHYPILVQASRTLANSTLRNRATLVGNLCNASPGGDMLCPSIVLQGQVEAMSVGGKRLIPLSEFFIGVKKTVLKTDEMVTKIIFPNMSGVGRYMRKSRIKGHDLSQVCVAAFLKESNGLSIAVGAAAPVPVIIKGFESITKKEIRTKKSQIVEKVINEIRPISDQRAGKEYRRAMAGYLTHQILEELEREAF